ncbi:MAG: hypothetical protein RLY16_174 [Bacteroidota bacterium]|jgi:hypothetical protein
MNSISSAITFLLLIIIGISACSSPKKDPRIAQMMEVQQSHFCLSVDSASMAWTRLLYYLDLRKHSIGGGEWQENDSTIYIPYGNSQKKGNSLKIIRRFEGERVCININWWYNQMREELGEKEIGLYMLHGIEL